MDDDGNPTEMAHPAELPAETIERLRKRLRTEQREVFVLRTVVALLWRCDGYRQMWRINGEGKRRHLNNGRGTSYGALEDARTGKVLITTAQQCKAVERALRG